MRNVFIGLAFMCVVAPAREEKDDNFESFDGTYTFRFDGDDGAGVAKAASDCGVRHGVADVESSDRADRMSVTVHFEDASSDDQDRVVACMENHGAVSRLVE